MRPNIEELLGEESAPPESGGIPEMLVDRYALARILGLTPSAINKLAANRILHRPETGRFHLADSVQAYLAHRLDSKPGTADKARREKANADLAELKAANLAGKLLDASDVEREWSAICRDLRAALLALPGRLSARLPHLAKSDLSAVDSELREALTALGGSNGQ